MKMSKIPHRAPDQRKISEAFLDFGAPVPVTMPFDATEAAIEHALRTPFVVWNAVVLQAVASTVPGVGQLWLAELVPFP